MHITKQRTENKEQARMGVLLLARRHRPLADIMRPGCFWVLSKLQKLRYSYGAPFSVRCFKVLYGALRCFTVPYGALRCFGVSYGAVRCRTVPYGVVEIVRCRTVSYGVRPVCQFVRPTVFVRSRIRTRRTERPHLPLCAFSFETRIQRF